MRIVINRQIIPTNIVLTTVDCVKSRRKQMNHFLEELNLKLLIVPFVLAAFMLVQVWN
jgi:hypothetical protein